jgi:Fungal protein kinase
MASQRSQHIPCIPDQQYPKPNHLSSIDASISLGASYSPSPVTLDSDGVLINFRDFPPVAAVPLPDAAFVSESSTPLKGRISSYDADHKSAIKSPTITCREIGALLLKEFRAELELEHTTLDSELFPSDSFPCATGVLLKDRNFLTHMSNVWSTSLNTWSPALTTNTEFSVTQWLNVIGEEFSRVTKIPILRKWSPDSCNIPLPGAIPGTPLKSKPDIVLMDVIPPGLPRSRNSSWRNIHAFGEVTTRDSFHTTMRKTIYTKTHVLFAAQETRRFVCSLAFYGKELRLNVIDHEGIMYQKFSLDGGFDNALKIIRVVAGFMCGHLTSLGHDSTVSRNPDGTVNTINVEDDAGNITTYRVLSKLHVATGIVGRCTRVWLGHELGDEKTRVVIKDAWPLESRSNLEEDVLMHLQTVPGIPVLTRSITVLTQYAGQDCKDSTSIYRLAASTIRSDCNRVHRRLVMLSVGVRLHHFRSLSELIGAFRDVVISE